MKYILLEDWARQNKVKPTDAKNWARRGKFGKSAKKQPTRITRWVIDEDYRFLPLQANQTTIPVSAYGR